VFAREPPWFSIPEFTHYARSKSVNPKRKLRWSQDLPQTLCWRSFCLPFFFDPFPFLTEFGGRPPPFCKRPGPPSTSNSSFEFFLLDPLLFFRLSM